MFEAHVGPSLPGFPVGLSGGVACGGVGWGGVLKPLGESKHSFCGALF